MLAAYRLENPEFPVPDSALAHWAEPLGGSLGACPENGAIVTLAAVRAWDSGSEELRRRLRLRRRGEEEDAESPDGAHARREQRTSRQAHGKNEYEEYAPGTESRGSDTYDESAAPEAITSENGSRIVFVFVFFFFVFLFFFFFFQPEPKRALAAQTVQRPK